MFKRAKLYSLLAIIVVSTVVGLFGFERTVLAQEAGCTTATRSEGNASDITIYCGPVQYIEQKNISDADDDNAYLYGFLKQGEASANGEDGMYFDPGTRIFTGTTAANNDLIYVIAFAPDVDPFSATEPIAAEWIYFRQLPNGPYQGGYDPQGSKSIQFDPGAEPDTGAVDDGVYDDDPYDLVDDTPASPPSCQIKGIGWLICPVVVFLGEITDATYEALDSTFLKLEPIALPGSEANTDRMQLYESWKVMRDIANVVFIIGFLVIVFSQVTSFGVSNYGVKRLLPKIIIAAILVNVSYFLCAVAVDLSNIIGNSMRGLLMPDEVASLEFDFEYKNGEDTHSVVESGFGGIANFIVGSTMAIGAIYIFLPAFLPLVLSAAVAVVTVLVALTIRQALVVILIVISPLAFVALLLPNTESLFQKWRSLFVTMLMVYPIISVIFGASALASKILMSTDDFPTQMVGAGVAVIPLALTPIVMKVSGGLLNRWVGIVNDPSKGWVDGKRNALANRGKIIKAGRVARTADWVDNAGISGEVFGAAGSKRRRALTWMTSYGANVRERAEKDNLEKAESTLEGSYLESEKGLQTRNATKNAKAELENAQISAETVRLQSLEGIAIEERSTERQMRKQLAENQAQTAAISAIPAALAAQSKDAELGKQIAENTSKVAGLAGANTDLKMRAATSAENLSAAEGRDKQAYEETIAGTAAAGVSAATAAAAQDARQDLTVVSGATESAKRVSEQAHAEEILSNPALATEIGGIDSDGRARAEARAAATIDRGDNEAVDNAVALIKRRSTPDTLLAEAEKDLRNANDNGDVTTARAAAKILAGAGTKGNAMLDEVILDIENTTTAGSPDKNVFTNLKADLVGTKGTNVARDRWATGTDTLAANQANSAHIRALDQGELVGQQMNVLKAAAAANAFQDPDNYALVQSVLDQVKKGTLKMDQEKRQLFEQIAANPPVMHGPPAPPPPVYGPPAPPPPHGPPSPGDLGMRSDEV